jgi:enamine deaminase RidA (YjgF/YER057c/UK114 family)
LNVLAVIQSTIGSLDAVKRIVKLNGWVASAEGFTSQPKVVDGASLLLEEIFGEAGQHARSAIGVAELPLGATVELELIAEIQS